jgi:hypothetical protein
MNTSSKVTTWEQLGDLPIHVDTWDCDPALDDAEAEDISFDTVVSKVFNANQLRAIAALLRDGEVPLRLRLNGGRTKNPYELFLISEVSEMTAERLIYSRIDTWPGSASYLGELPHGFENLK